MTNKFRGYCHRCGAEIAAGAGLCLRVDGAWKVECVTPCEAKPAVERQAPPKPAVAQVGDVAGVISLFDKAKKHLKRPAIELGVYDDPQFDFPPIRISIAGESAKVPGSLTVLSADKIDKGGEYPERNWLGRILLNGTFEPSRELRADPPYARAVAARLAAFAANPTKVGGEDGRLHGRCCFCRIALTDERSTLAGYGKKCAQNFGLDWGDKPAEFASATPKRKRKAKAADEFDGGNPGDDLTTGQSEYGTLLSRSGIDSE